MGYTKSKKNIIVGFSRYLLCYRVRFSGLILALLLNGGFSTSAKASIESHFLYQLSNFYGPVPYSWARIRVDENRNEVYVVDTMEVNIRIFNAQGMEIYRFGDDGNLGSVLDLAIEENGNLIVLSRNRFERSIIVCNFRGEPISRLELTNLPAEFSGFSPDQMVYRREKLYLLDANDSTIVVTKTNGVFLNGYDLIDLIDFEGKKPDGIEVVGFSVDDDGNVFFSIPVLFSVFKLFPDSTLLSFGEPGGAPGKFNLAGGVAVDDRNNIFVADWLKSAVLIFDKDFSFQTQFGYRGERPENITAPKYLALDSKGRLYVSQVGGRGVSVFKIDYD